MQIKCNCFIFKIIFEVRNNVINLLSQIIMYRNFLAMRTFIKPAQQAIAITRTLD